MLITTIVIIGVALFGGLGYFLYCDLKMQKVLKASKEEQNNKK